ncbi:MAG: tRNA (adenosine(37)-N6)-threonylcarbamoyltransferase complex ATPase subunit type 1 TsaE, partial [Clostridia bacterium]|nr:tRNA (adenosine(37)-N6)-threonylcarbamoyltransferase complex ATPase subunit type 1 TsaE [Clostridia bacterium]
MQEFFSRSENDTLNIAKEFASHLKGGEVIAFIGGLGMGKTAFVRGALLGMHNDSRVSSPTFALV